MERGRLADEAVADDAELPDTGVGLAMERLLSPLFLGGPVYGTCSQAALVVYVAIEFVRGASGLPVSDSDSRPH